MPVPAKDSPEIQGDRTPSRERDLLGYGGRPPDAQWPGDARVAVQFVLNLEEGAESSLLNGDGQSEAWLHELQGRPPRRGERDPSIESLYEYGSRAGVWRLLELFEERGRPLTVFATGRALELNPALGPAFGGAGHEVAGHGYRWLDYHGIPRDQEAEHIARTVAVIEQQCGQRPIGWYTGRQSLHTRELVREAGLSYSSDTYNDDLPYWLPGAPPLLMIPYSLVTNDARYLLPHGIATGADFLTLLKDAFDCLWHEGDRCPKLMSIGLHPRISGHPARAMAVARFLDYLDTRNQVWICRRADIARHWMERHPAF